MTIFNGQIHYNHFYGARTVYNDSVKVVSDGTYNTTRDPLTK